MNTADLATRLDAHLHLDRFATDDFEIIIEFCQEAGIPIQKYATPTFLHRFNGLMLNNADTVSRVFILVFPSDDVLADVESRAAGQPSLIFTHHPMDMETGDRGLVPIGEEWLNRLREARVSLYAAHAPLDCHEATSTSRALARALGVPAQTTFAGYFGGHAGVHGRIDPVSFRQFADRVRDACGVEHVETKVHGDTVSHVAVVAGGAAYPPLMQEALDAGCDTYVTGDFRVRHGGPWAEEHRPPQPHRRLPLRHRVARPQGRHARLLPRARPARRVRPPAGPLAMTISCPAPDRPRIRRTYGRRCNPILCWSDRGRSLPAPGCLDATENVLPTGEPEGQSPSESKVTGVWVGHFTFRYQGSDSRP